MSSTPFQDASEWGWSLDGEAGDEPPIDEAAEREWQELLGWARESGALYTPDPVEAEADEQAEDQVEEEEWQWQVARAKATSGDVA